MKKYVIALALACAGCKTFGRVVDVIDWSGEALSATADILRATGDDIGSVWDFTGISPEAPAAPPAD